MSPDPQLSRLALIQTLERVCACREILESALRPGAEPSWELGFINSIYKSLHRGLVLTPRQEVVLTRLESKLAPHRKEPCP
jgi:hypothetical protein